jgi:SAM-dependent methyltransferase
MLAIYPLPVAPPKTAPPPSALTVMLANGQHLSLENLSCRQLHELQWEQEQKFARAILAFPAGSPQRSMILGQAYDTISVIVSRLESEMGQASGADADRMMRPGLDARYVKLVLRLLENQVARGIGQPRLFEIGYGSGWLLHEVRSYGYDVSGVEASSEMRTRAAAALGDRYASGLHVGDFRTLSAADLPGAPTLVYWNDVMEHVPADEVEDYLVHIYELLAPRGQLVTVTPNWLLRPSDVTGDFMPPRTEARGLHLKEYRLAEVTRLLKRAGFRRIATPLAATHNRLILCGGGGCLVKRWLEPVLERLPVRAAHLLCRGLAMSCTIATK